jgi:hypothetical protein
MRAVCLTHIILLDLVTLNNIFVKRTSYEAPT